MVMVDLLKIFIFLGIIGLSIFLIHKTWTNSGYIKPLWMNILIIIATLTFAISFSIKFF